MKMWVDEEELYLFIIPFLVNHVSEIKMLQSRYIITLEFNKKQNRIKSKFASSMQLFLQQSLNIAEGKLLQQQIGHTRYFVQLTMTKK